MKFLTYNLAWEGQDGKDTAGAKGSKCVVGGVNKCRENVMKVIADGDYDFILLQETSFGDPPSLKVPGYSLMFVKKGAETLFMLYRTGKKSLQAFAGELSGTEVGRPYMVVIFDDIVVINLHAPHSWSVPKIFSRLETAFKSKNLESMLDRPIVIGGDFNMDVGKTMTGFCRKFTSEPVHAKTCCDANFGEGGEAAYFGSFDHFLISPSLKFHLAGTVKDGKDNVLHSDHLPLYAVIGPKKKGKGRTRRRRTSRAV